jgi:hypothetical protein
MSYIIRDKDGIMKAKISNALAKRVINEVYGEFYKRFCGKTCYRILEASVYSLGFREMEVHVYLWEEDILIPSLD